MLSFDDLNEADFRDDSLIMVLSRHLPNHRGRKGWVSPQKLGPALGTTKQAASRWLANNSLPPQRVNPLINLPGSTLTRAMLLPFVNFG